MQPGIREAAFGGGGPQGPPLLQKLEWVKSALELVLLLLAIPWILFRLFRDGGRGLRDLGEGWFG